jgi:predicted DNA binding CopG/RHH family protein
MHLMTTASPATVPKVAQINIRLTAEQLRLFKQHCNRSGMNTQAAVVNALRQIIDGF